jgi:hypothetical protein
LPTSQPRSKLLEKRRKILILLAPRDGFEIM